VPDIRIYAAPSLTEVIKQLWMYRSSGILTIWPAIGARQEDTRITIELGRPLYVHRGSHWENATESIMVWLNSWGEIHFLFQSTEARLRLPPPAFSAPAQSTSLQQKPLSINTQTLRTLSTNNWATQPTQLSSLHTTNQQAKALPGNSSRTGELPIPHDLLHEEGKNSLTTSNDRSPATMAGKTAIASLTSYGRVFPPANLPRYDRTIFLLINGRRTIADFSQLTKRSTEEIYASLHRLQNLQIITIETLPAQP